MDEVRSISRGDRIARAQKQSVSSLCFLLTWSCSYGSSFGWSRGWTRFIWFLREVRVEGIIKLVDVGFSNDVWFLYLNPKSQLNGWENRFNLNQWVLIERKKLFWMLSSPYWPESWKTVFVGVPWILMWIPVHETIKSLLLLSGNPKIINRDELFI